MQINVVVMLTMRKVERFARSPAASLAFMGQVTEHTTAK